ncbi:amino acid ABC transporter permease, partial [Rhizobium sp. PEPV16]
MHNLSWEILYESLPALAAGTVVTLQITITAVIAGISLGTVLALLRLSNITAL